MNPILHRHLKEFPDYGTLPPRIAALVADQTLTDVSWHNDVCPSFVHADDAHAQVDECRTLWCDYEKPEDREFSSGTRFTVQFPSGRTKHFATEDEALAAFL